MRLRRLKEEDAPYMLEWMKDSNIQKNFRFPIEKTSIDEVMGFIRSAEIQLIDGKSIHYAIADDNDEYMGTISLKDVSLKDGNAEYAISLRKCAQGKGIGTAATREIMKLAFESFGLHRVYLNVLSDNVRAISLYERFGFVYEGEFKEHLYLRGEYKSLKWYAMLKEDYDKLTTK